MFSKILKCYSFCFVCLFFSHVAFANSFEELYGNELKSVPYAMRVSYERETGGAWQNASYDERLDFIERFTELENNEKKMERNVELQKEKLKNEKEKYLRDKRRIEESKVKAREKAKEYQKRVDEKKKQAFIKKNNDAKRKLRKLSSN